MTTILSVETARTRDDGIPQAPRPNPFARSAAARAAGTLTAWDEQVLAPTFAEPAVAAAPAAVAAPPPAPHALPRNPAPARSHTVRPGQAAPRARPVPVAQTAAPALATPAAHRTDSRSSNAAGIAATVAVLLTIAVMTGLSMSRTSADTPPSGGGPADVGTIVPQAPNANLPSVMPYGNGW